MELKKKAESLLDHEKAKRQVLLQGPNTRASVQEPPAAGKPAEDGRRGKDRFKVSELFADERCSKAILDFLATTEVGQTAGPPVADEGPGSEASEWEKREHEECLAQAAEEGRALGEGPEDAKIDQNAPFLEASTSS